MPDEAFASPSWEHSVDPNGASSSGSSSFPQSIPHTPSTTDPASPTNLLPSPPRSSSESASRTPSSKWGESFGQTTLERRDTITTITTNPEITNVVEPNFDENVLRMLCDLDVSVLRSGGWCPGTQRLPFDQCSVPLLLDRIKQSTVSCKVCRPTGALCFFGCQQLFYRRRRFFSRRGPCWRMNTVETCRSSPAQRLSYTRWVKAKPGETTFAWTGGLSNAEN